MAGLRKAPCPQSLHWSWRSLWHVKLADSNLSIESLAEWYCVTEHVFCCFVNILPTSSSSFSSPSSTSWSSSWSWSWSSLSSSSTSIHNFVLCVLQHFHDLQWHTHRHAVNLCLSFLKVIWKWVCGITFMYFWDLPPSEFRTPSGYAICFLHFFITTKLFGQPNRFPALHFCVQRFWGLRESTAKSIATETRSPRPNVGTLSRQKNIMTAFSGSRKNSVENAGED